MLVVTIINHEITDELPIPFQVIGGVSGVTVSDGICTIGDDSGSDFRDIPFKGRVVVHTESGVCVGTYKDAVEEADGAVAETVPEN